MNHTNRTNRAGGSPGPATLTGPSRRNWRLVASFDASGSTTAAALREALRGPDTICYPLQACGDGVLLKVSYAANGPAPDPLEAALLAYTDGLLTGEVLGRDSCGTPLVYRFGTGAWERQTRVRGRFERLAPTTLVPLEGANRRAAEVGSAA